jgi:hypothetical protein
MPEDSNRSVRMSGLSSLCGRIRLDGLELSCWLGSTPPPILPAAQGWAGISRRCAIRFGFDTTETEG